MNIGPKNHLSPSSANAWERCAVQWRIFHLEGALSPPDVSLEIKRQTHNTILEFDLAQKIESKKNLGVQDLQEHFIAGIESKAGLMKDDPNRTELVEKIINTETAYFAKIAAQTEPWRKAVVPLAVEQKVEFDLGGIPIVGYYDLKADEKVNDRILDLKRQGQATKGGSGKSRQMATYAIGTGIADVGLVQIIENVTPRIETDEGQITQGLVERTKTQYQVIAAQIDHAIEKDIWLPVDTSDNRKAWICSARFCSAWRIGAKDIRTGRDITCPFGQKSAESVYVSRG
jgi:hypothetical protein